MAMRNIPFKDEAQRQQYPLEQMFHRVCRLLTRCGARHVVGVLDSKLAKASKLERGNISKFGKMSARNRDGLRNGYIHMFHALGCSCVVAPDTVAEGEAYCAWLQQQG